MVSDDALMKGIQWALDVDPDAIRAATKNLPGSTPAERADAVFSRAAWRATAIGIATGLPTNPLVGVPAAVVDVATVLRVEVNAAAKTALLFDPTFFDDPDAAWELLIPILGLNAVSQALRTLGVKGGMGVSRQVIRTYLTKETLRQFKRIVLKYFGIKVGQRALITKALPIIGGLIGGTWNFVEVRLMGRRTIAYFGDRAIGTVVEGAADRDDAPPRPPEPPPADVPPATDTPSS